MKLKNLLMTEATQTMAEVLQGMLDADMQDTIKHHGWEAKFDEMREVLDPKIVKALNKPGKIVHADELIFNLDDLGKPDAKPNFDPHNGAEWQVEELPNVSVVVQEVHSGNLWQHLYAHKTEPFMYFVATDGESGVCQIVKLKH